MLEIQKENGIQNLLKNFCSDKEHASQVAKVALLLFDKTYGVLHSFSARDRQMLQAGALLHDIGYSIGPDDHNKHSYKLITHHGIEGFNEEEVEIIGLIARYHRGKKPSKSQSAYRNIEDKKTRKLVKKLASFVRMADGLDRSHLCIVDDLECIYDSFSAILQVVLKLKMPGCSSEICTANKKKDLFEDEFNATVVFRC